MRREIRHVFIRIVPSKKGDIILECPEEDLRHFARRPSAWIRAVCTWIVGCDGRLELSTDFQASGDNKTCHSVDLTSDAVWPYYIFTAKPTAERPEAVVNLADVRKRGAQSASHSSFASSELDTEKTICARDGQKCISTQRPDYQQAHIVPFRVQCKGRWNALSAARFGGIDINSAENIISLGYGLHKAIDEDFRFAILPLGPLLSAADVHPQTESPPWPYDADDLDTTASTTLLLHQIPRATIDADPQASKKQVTQMTEEESKKKRELLAEHRKYEQKANKYYSKLCPHNLRLRFHNEAHSPPKREVLEYWYAMMILERYGTDETKAILHDDWLGPLGHIHRNKDQDDEDEKYGNYGEGSDRDGHGGLVAGDGPPQSVKRPQSRRTMARTNRSKLDQAFDMMYNINYHLHVAPMEAEAELLASRERAEKEAAIQHWVDGVSPDLHAQSSM